MAFTLVQAGTTLYAVNPDGGWAALSLPTGITLSAQKVPRFARFKRYAILVNTPSRPILIATDGTTYPLTPLPPGAAMTLTNANGGALSGTYTAKYTHRILDSLGNVITESDYSPVSNEVTITTDFLAASGIAVSTETITDRNLYRIATNGSSYFPWIVLDGNILTTLQDDTPDASLGLISAAALGSAPDLTLVCEFQGRVWGVDRTNMDDLRYTEVGKAYAWSALNTLPIPHVGEDQYGIMALIPRRNALGVGRARGLVSVTGTTTANIKPTTLKEELGVISQESVVVYKDMAFWLWRDGVYKWDDNGVVSITDEKVRSWFTTDDTFNRAMFARAFAVLDTTNGLYHLFLASAGQFTTDRWVTYDILRKTWWGPNKTDAFVPSSAFLVRGANGLPFHMIGSTAGVISLEQEDKNDWDALPIEMKTLGREHDADEPNREKVWGALSVLGDATPGICDVVPYVGDPDNIERTASMDYTMSKGREQLDRVGFGSRCQIAFEHKTINQDVKIHGYELPFSFRGIR